jgi:hypothetical protein
MEEGSNPGGSSLTAALNRDALEEVFTHCSPADLLAAAQTCRTAADLLHRSERVWTAKLRESYGLGLKVGAGCGGVGRCCLVHCADTDQRRQKQAAAAGGGGALDRATRTTTCCLGCCPCCPALQAQAGGDGLFVRLARRVYEASRAQQLRFQGVYVGGGVDEVRGGRLSAACRKHVEVTSRLLIDAIIFQQTISSLSYTIITSHRASHHSSSSHRHPSVCR